MLVGGGWRSTGANAGPDDLARRSRREIEFRRRHDRWSVLREWRLQLTWDLLACCPIPTKCSAVIARQKTCMGSEVDALPTPLTLRRIIRRRNRNHETPKTSGDAKTHRL